MNRKIYIKTCLLFSNKYNVNLFIFKLRTDFNLLLFNLVVAETGIAVFGIITDFVATARYIYDTTCRDGHL